MSINGFYINLDRSPDRREHMEAQARKLGIDWLQRFPAIDGQQLKPSPRCALSAGGLACFMSHLQVIESSPADSFTFVFEDDVELSADLPMVLHEAQLQALADYDLILLDCQPNFTSATLLMLWGSLVRQLANQEDLGHDGAARHLRGVDVYNAPGLYCWGMSSYVVTPKGHRTLPPLLRHCLDRGPPGQMDIFVSHACEDRRLKAAVLVPFLATPLLESYEGTTIDQRSQSAEKLALVSAIRRMFFAGPVSGIQEYAQPLLSQAEAVNPQLQLLSRLMGRIFELSARDGKFVVG